MVGPMRGEIFRAYVEQMLAPALSPGDEVVLDNLAARDQGCRSHLAVSAALQP
jgi:transposase